MQTAVNKFTGGFDSGGGFSTLFPAQDYQASHTKGYVETRAAPPAGTFNSTNRYGIYLPMAPSYVYVDNLHVAATAVS